MLRTKKINKMKVLKIIHTLGHGGAENTFRWLAWGLRREGLEVIAAIPEMNNPQEENWITPALDELDVPYITFDTSGNPLKLVNNLVLLIDKVRPDIVHSHLLDSNFYSSIACKCLAVPHISTEHGDVSFNQTPITRIKYGLLSLCSRYITCVSDSVKDKTYKVAFMKSKLKTVYNGIQFIENTSSTFRKELNIDDRSILIGNVGNLYPIKGQKYLIMAFSEFLRSSTADAYLILVGRGIETDRLKGLVSLMGIPQDRVIFAGFRNDISNILNAIDLYVQPSLSEGHPIAILEALSAGIPVIATAVGGVPEVIGNDRFGTLAIPESWENLHNLMDIYIQHPDIFREKAFKAKKYVRETFSIEKMVSNYISIYLQALKYPGISPQ
jgi:glycosyltransferase involved in cell wall biosynthesis